MKSLQTIKSVVFAVIILVCFTSCSKDDINTDAQFAGVSVKLKSTVGELEKVYIEVESVQLRVKENAEALDAWVTLNTINEGAQKTSDLIENSELLLVDGFEIKATSIYEIRLVLGDNNFVDLNNVLYSLDITEAGNAAPSSLVQSELLANHFYDFTIDIDIDESVSFDEAENMMVLNPKLYTELRQTKY